MTEISHSQQTPVKLSETQADQPLTTMGALKYGLGVSTAIGVGTYIMDQIVPGTSYMADDYSWWQNTAIVTPFAVMAGAAFTAAEALTKQSTFRGMIPAVAYSLALKFMIYPVEATIAQQFDPPGSEPQIMFKVPDSNKVDAFHTNTADSLKTNPQRAIYPTGRLTQ